MSVKGTDLSTSRVLQNLHAIAGFRAADGWELKEWRRELTLPMKGKKDHITAMHVRPYLFHTASMTVITVQIKAWMDSAGAHLNSSSKDSTYDNQPSDLPQSPPEHF